MFVSIPHKEFWYQLNFLEKWVLLANLFSLVHSRNQHKSNTRMNMLESWQKEYLHKHLTVSVATRTLQIQAGFCEALVLRLQMQPTVAMELLLQN